MMNWGKAFPGLVLALNAAFVFLLLPYAWPEPSEPKAKKSRALGILFFYSPGCESCEEIRNHVLPIVRRRFGSKIAIKSYDTNEMANYEVLIKYEEHYGSKENEELKVFVGDTYLAGAKAIATKLESTVETLLHRQVFTEDLQAIGRADASATTKPLASKGSSAPALIVERFKSFRSFTVMAAGLADGVNPCAFATIVFLISLLGYLGRSKREVLIVGIFFTTAVFLTYLVLGLGIFRVVKIFSVSRGISRGITVTIGILAIVLGAYSTYDFVVWRKSRSSSDIKLKLPARLEKAIHAIMRTKLRARNLVLGSLIVGFAVAILESVCTGQVYLPTIMFVLNDASLRLHGLFYLVLYNLCFILPLIVIFALAYQGFASERLGGFLKRHLGALKASLAVIFFGLGILLLTNL